MIGDIIVALFIWYVVLPWLGVGLLWILVGLVRLTFPSH